MEWVRSLERYFDFEDTLETKKYKLERLKLVKQAALLFNDL